MFKNPDDLEDEMDKFTLKAAELEAQIDLLCLGYSERVQCAVFASCLVAIAKNQKRPEKALQQILNGLKTLYDECNSPV